MTDGGRSLPVPRWNSCASLLDSLSCRVALEELDAESVAWVKEKCRGYGLEDLVQRCGEPEGDLAEHRTGQIRVRKMYDADSAEHRTGQISVRKS